MRRSVCILAWVLLGVCNGASAQRVISADSYLDRAKGMWLGELMGNYAGRPVEGQVARGGLTYAVDWDTVLATDPWVADDDTLIEYVYLDLIGGNPSPAGALLLGIAAMFLTARRRRRMA